MHDMLNLEVVTLQLQTNTPGSTHRPTKNRTLEASPGTGGTKSALFFGHFTQQNIELLFLYFLLDRKSCHLAPTDNQEEFAKWNGLLVFPTSLLHGQLVSALRAAHVDVFWVNSLAKNRTTCKQINWRCKDWRLKTQLSQHVWYLNTCFVRTLSDHSCVHRYECC